MKSFDLSQLSEPQLYELAARYLRRCDTSRDAVTRLGWQQQIQVVVNEIAIREVERSAA